MINFKKEWRWMDKLTRPPQAFKGHPYYDSKSKQQSYTIAAVSMMAAIILVLGMAVYNQLTT